MDFFTTESAELHLTPTQLKRRIKATAIKPAKVTMTGMDSCSIQGSGAEPYVVTLASCTCSDFQIACKRKVPCKHIYYLADRLGVLTLPEGNPDGRRRTEAEFPSEISRWKNEFLAGNITPECYWKILEAFSK